MARLKFAPGVSLVLCSFGLRMPPLVGLKALPEKPLDITAYQKHMSWVSRSALRENGGRWLYLLLPERKLQSVCFGAQDASPGCS